MATGPTLDEYQVGWICSDPIVAAAAQQMLDDGFAPLEEQDSADTNTYTLGRVGKHFIAIACVGGQHHAATSATATAINTMRTFPTLHIALVISTGGTIPSPENDIRLGDVVISYPTDTCGGILQFDLGRIRDDRNIHRVVPLNYPPKTLLAAVDHIRAAALRNDPLFLDYMAEATQRTARTQRNFKYLGENHDRLFRVEQEEIPDSANCAESALGCEIERNEREDIEPQLFYGTIASGNALVEHGPTRAHFGKETGALCFETVAAGVIQDLPCLAICGISNYADSDNKLWEGYASMAAAAYAKELLGYVPRGQSRAPGMLAAIGTTILRDEGPSQKTDTSGAGTRREWLKIKKAPTLASEYDNETESLPRPSERLLHTRFDWVD